MNLNDRKFRVTFDLEVSEFQKTGEKKLKHEIALALMPFGKVVGIDVIEETRP